MSKKKNKIDRTKSPILNFGYILLNIHLILYLVTFSSHALSAVGHHQNFSLELNTFAILLNVLNEWHFLTVAIQLGE